MEKPTFDEYLALRKLLLADINRSILARLGLDSIEKTIEDIEKEWEAWTPIIGRRKKYPEVTLERGSLRRRIELDDITILIYLATDQNNHYRIEILNNYNYGRPVIGKLTLEFLEIETLQKGITDFINSVLT